MIKACMCMRSEVQLHLARCQSFLLVIEYLNKSTYSHGLRYNTHITSDYVHCKLKPLFLMWLMVVKILRKSGQILWSCVKIIYKRNFLPTTILLFIWKTCHNQYHTSTHVHNYEIENTTVLHSNKLFIWWQTSS